MSTRYKAKQNVFRRFYLSVKANHFACGIRACYRYDSRVKNMIDGLPDGFDLCVGILGSTNAIVVTKVGDRLHSKMVEGYIPSDGLQIFFKNYQGAMMVLSNRISVLQAYTQSRVVIVGDAQRSIDFINLFVIVQNYLASARARKRHLGTLSSYEVSARKIKTYAAFRGWA